jgi:acyl-CoA-binding protein
MTLNEIEEVRKMVNRLSGDTPSNMAFGGDIKTMIDAVTENAGGDLFKEARRKRTKFANEFENIGLIDDLLSKKPKSNDRVVALEKVFDKSVMQSDLDSLKSLGYTLKKTEKGQQAWAELKGQTIENLRNAITSNIETDSLGQRTFNPKQFDVIVKNLDKSGKLDYLLGKAGAQEIRNLRDTVIAINSPVKGINTSNTSSAINKVFNDIIKKTVGKIPLGGQLFEAGAEAVEKQNIAKKVQKSLEFKPEDVAKELRKGK